MLTTIGIFLLKPLNQTAFLIIVATLLRIFWRSNVHCKRWSIRISVIALSWLFVCSQTWFAHVVMWPLEQYSQRNQASLLQLSEQTDYLFVLGCYYNTESANPVVNRFNHCALERLTYAHILNQKTGIPIIVTGGYFLRDSAISFAFAAQQYLIDLGTHKADILLIQQGTNSAEEIGSVAQRFGSDKRYAVISSASHTYRLGKLLQAAKFSDYLFFSVDQENAPLTLTDAWLISPDNLAQTEKAFYEYGAIVKNMANGWQ